MAKPTLSDLATIVAAEIDETLVGVDGPFEPTENEITAMVNKIGKQLMLGSNFEDRLPELEGELLPYGATIEEYFIDLILPNNFDNDGANALAPARPSFEDIVYSYPLAKKTFKTTVDYGKIEQGMLGESEFSTLVARITKQLYDSLAIYKYALKRQLLGSAIDRLPTTVTPKNVVKLAIPTTTATAEAFAKSVKDKVEYMTHIHDDMAIESGVVTRSDLADLVLYVSEGILSVLDVDLEAGAFNVGKVQVPVTIKALEDFGTLTAHTDTYAVLVDTRGVKLHTHRESATSQPNGEGEFMNYFLHHQPTGFISKYTNICIWEEPGE